MGKRRTTQSPLETLILFFILLARLLLSVIVRILVFVYDLITFYTSQYKQKSGNNYFKTYFNKGNYGEFLLYRKVIRIFGKESVLTNIYLEHKNTETTEIDVLAVSCKGIYVFEMKNYSGYIYGSQKDQYWTQVLNKWVKNKFYNPLKQNYAHTKAVESYLGISSDFIVPLIVFSNNSKLSKINIDDFHNVYQFRDTIRFIKKNEKKNKDILSIELKEDYLIKLLSKCNMDEEVKLRHIKNVKEHVNLQKPI